MIKGVFIINNHGQPRAARVLGEPAYDAQSLKPRADSEQETAV